jgi:Domain of unknown function (DUF5134)
MPGWLGVALAAAFTLVCAHRAVWRDAPGALMAAGMAAMSLGMAGIGPMLVRGPWWALVFVVVAVWPLSRPVLARVAPLRVDRAGPVCGGPLSHLLGGVAMFYMCAAPMVGMSGVPDGSALTAHASHLPAMTAMTSMPSAGGAAMDLDMPTASGPLALVGWALACYFLLGTVTALTRRGPDGRYPRAARLPLLGEAVMGFGTVIMLVAMT